MITAVKRSFVRFRNEPLETLFVFLVFLLPLGAAGVRHWSTSIGYFLLLISLCGMRGQWSHLEISIKRIGYAFLVFFVIAALSILKSIDVSASISRLGKLTWLLAFIPMALMARRTKTELTKPLLLGFAISGLVNLAVSCYDIFTLGLVRATGPYNPILMGSITAAAVLLGIVDFAMSNRKLEYRVFLAICISGSLITCVLSGTKSAWVTLFFSVPLVIWMIRRSISQRQMLFICLSIFVLLAVLYGFQKDRVNQRFLQTTNGIQRILQGDESDLSLGVRWSMWKAALQMWSENPILGTGLGDYRHDILKLKEENNTQLEIIFSKAHNIYLEALSTTGIIGLLAFLAAIIYLPFKLFYTCLEKEYQYRDPNPCILGIITIVAFGILGMFNSWLARNYMIVPYVICIMVFSSDVFQSKAS